MLPYGVTTQRAQMCFKGILKTSLKVFKTGLQDGYEDLKTLTDPSFWRRIFKVPKTNGATRQQAIAWADVDPDLCRHMTSLGHNELKN